MKPLLKVADLNAWYGESHVLHGVDMTVGEAEMVTLLGRNASARRRPARDHGDRARAEVKSASPARTSSTCPSTASPIAAWIRPRGARHILHAYLYEKSPAAAGGREGGMTIDEIFELFPNLHEAPANSAGTKLSGGEQQMLAIAASCGPESG